MVLSVPMLYVRGNIYYILKETSNAKSELMLLEWAPLLCLCFVQYDMRFINNLIIAMYDIMNYSLLMPNAKYIKVP